MKYIDSSVLEADQTVAYWMDEVVASGVKEFRCQAGYFTLEGTSPVLSSISKCASAGAQVSLLLGSNDGSTLASHISFLAGKLNVPLANVSLGIVRYEDALFHPKVYVFHRCDGSITAYVGSANMTGSGVSGRNVEAGLILDSLNGDDEAIIEQISSRIDDWFAHPPESLFIIDGPDVIEALLTDGDLATRPAPRLGLGKDEKGNGAEKPKKARRKPLIKLPPIPDRKKETSRKAKILDLPTPQLQKLSVRTEASYHYPQGTHLGHLLSIMFHFSGDRSETPFDDKFIRLRGGFGSGRIAGYRRQIKYKILAATELGLVTDIRLSEDPENFTVEISKQGEAFYNALKPYVNQNDLAFEKQEDGLYSSVMPLAPAKYNTIISDACISSPEVKLAYSEILENMSAVAQMKNFLVSVVVGEKVNKSLIYKEFFRYPDVLEFCDLVGIDPASEEGAKHRCPFLLNILESIGFIEQGRSEVTLKAG
jgi:hypothetical protein